MAVYITIVNCSKQPAGHLNSMKSLCSILLHYTNKIMLGDWLGNLKRTFNNVNIWGEESSLPPRGPLFLLKRACRSCCFFLSFSSSSKAESYPLAAFCNEGIHMRITAEIEK